MSQHCEGWELPEALRSNLRGRCELFCPRFKTCVVDGLLLELDLSQILALKA